MAKNRLPTFLSEDATSWVAFSLFTPVSVLGVPLTIANETSSPGAFLQWVGIGFIATLASSLPIVAFHIRSRKQMPNLALHSRVGLTVISAGAMRGLAIVVLSEPSGLHDEALPIVRILNSTLTTTIWLVIAGLAIASRKTYVQDYQRLFSRAVASRAHELSDSESDDSMSDLDHVARKLLSVGTRLRFSFNSVASSDTETTDIDRDSIRGIAQYIHDTVEREIRPLSHRLWFKEPFLPPRVRIATLVADAVTRQPVPIGQVSWFVIPGLFIGLPVRLGLPDGATLALASATAVYAILLLANRFSESEFSKYAAVLALILLPIVPAVIDLVIHNVNSSRVVNELYVFVSMFGLVALIIMLQMVLMARSDRALVLRELEQITQQPSLNNLDDVTVERVRIASYLHNTVQSELTSVALQLENAADANDIEAVRSTLVRAEQILNRSFVDDFNTFHASPAERVSALALAWQGIADVHIGAEDFVLLPRAVQLVASQVIEEGVANAVRSGDATQVTVEISLGEAGAEIVVCDNGVLKHGAEPGMGTSWLNSVAGTNWSRTSNDGQTILKVLLAVE